MGNRKYSSVKLSKHVTFAITCCIFCVPKGGKIVWDKIQSLDEKRPAAPFPSDTILSTNFNLDHNLSGIQVFVYSKYDINDHACMYALLTALMVSCLAKAANQVSLSFVRRASFNNIINISKRISHVFLCQTSKSISA